jgi:ribosomal protein S17
MEAMRTGPVEYVLTSTEAAAGAKPGEMPAGAVAKQVTVTVEVVAIDPAVPSVTFKGPEGNTKTIKVRDPQKLVGVKVGDMVDITYTQALAIKVDKAPAK